MSSVIMSKDDKQDCSDQDTDEVLEHILPDIESASMTSSHLLKPQSDNIDASESIFQTTIDIGISITSKRNQETLSDKNRSRDAKLVVSSKTLVEKTASNSKKNPKIVGIRKKNEETVTKTSDIKSNPHEKKSKRHEMKGKPATESTKHKVASLEQEGAHHGLDDKHSPRKKAIKRTTAMIGDADVEILTAAGSAVQKHMRSKEGGEVTTSPGEDVSKAVKKKKRVVEVQKKSEIGEEKVNDVRNESNQEVQISLKVKKNTLKTPRSSERSHICNDSKKTSQKETETLKHSMKLKVSTKKHSNKIQVLQGPLDSVSLEEWNIPGENTQADLSTPLMTNVTSPTEEMPGTTKTKLPDNKKRKRSPQEELDETPVKPKKKKKLDESLNNEASLTSTSQKVKKGRPKNKVADASTPANTQESVNLNDTSITSVDSSTPTTSNAKLQKKRLSVIPGDTQQPLLDDERLPEGWKRLVVQRQGGASMGKYDVYIIGPNKHKFRSRKELGTYIETEGIDLQAHNFDFSVFGKELVTAGGSAPRKSTKKSTGQAKVVDVAAEKPVKRTYTKRVKPGNLTYDQVHDIVTSDFLETRMCDRSIKWIPPRSPYNLIQEDLFQSPWQLLVATILLDKSPVLGANSIGETATSIIKGTVRRWPTPEAMAYADEKELAAFIKLFGNHQKRASAIKKFSEEFQSREWTNPNELHGIGKYGNDSYRIFCVNEWRNVLPSDVNLAMYKNWLNTNWPALCNNTNNCLGF